MSQTLTVCKNKKGGNIKKIRAQTNRHAVTGCGSALLPGLRSLGTRLSGRALHAGPPQAQPPRLYRVCPIAHTPRAARRAARRSTPGGPGQTNKLPRIKMPRQLSPMRTF